MVRGVERSRELICKRACDARYEYIKNFYSQQSCCSCLEVSLSLGFVSFSPCLSFPYSSKSVVTSMDSMIDASNQYWTWV